MTTTTTTTTLANILHDIETIELEEEFMTMPATPPEIIAANSFQHQNNVEIHKHIATTMNADFSNYIRKIEKIEKVYTADIYNGTIQTTPTNMVMVHYSPPYSIPYEDTMDISSNTLRKHLLLLIKQLQSINICLFDISPNNIQFHFKNGEWIPVIHDFSSAFMFLCDTYSHCYTPKMQCMTYIAPTVPLILPSKTLEVWIIRALLQTNATHLTPTLLENVTVNHTSITPTNSPFLIQYNDRSYKTLAKLVNHTTDKIICHFWQPAWQKNWPIYSAMFMIATMLE